MPAVQTPCPQCNQKTTFVVFTNQDEHGIIVRRRSCRSCNHKWYTYQQPEQQVSQYKLFWIDKKPFLKINPTSQINV